MPSGGGAQASPRPLNGRAVQTRDLGERLTHLPSSESHGEGGGCGAASIMGDSMVTPPNQISEAMYLQQEWLGKSSAASATFGGAGASPTDVAAFPAFDDDVGASKDASGSTNPSTNVIKGGSQATKSHLVLDKTRANQGTTPIDTAATTSVVSPNETTSAPSSRRKKQPDDLLAQMRKTRFFTNSMFSKKNCGSVKSSASSGRASSKKNKKKKAASRSITRPDAGTSFVNGSKHNEGKSGKVGPTQKRSQVNDVTLATEQHAGCGGRGSLVRPLEEEWIELGRTSDTVDNVLLGISTHGSSCCSDSGDISTGNDDVDEVVITRAQSPRSLVAIEDCDDASTSSAALVEPPPITSRLLPRTTRPQNAKNRATSSDSLSRRERRMQEVLSSLTFDVPTSVAGAESRAVERPWRSVDTAIERSRSHSCSHAALSFVFDGNAQEQSSIDDDSITVDSDDSSSSVPLNRYATANISLGKANTDIVDDKELFYDSDPGVVPVRRKTLTSGADENSVHSTNGGMEGTADGAVPGEGGVHMLSMNNSFDDESSFDAMYRLRDEEVRNVLEDVTSRKMEVIWHPTMSLSKDDRFDGHNAPIRCTAWINSPDESRPTFKWSPSDPHSIMSPERLQASKNAPYHIDLTSVVRVDAVDKIDRAQHPFGRSQNSFSVQTKSDVFLFQAPSRSDQEKNMRAIQLILARIESTKQPSPMAAPEGISALRDGMMVMTIDGLHEDEFVDNAGIEIVLPYNYNNASDAFTIEESLSFVKHS